MDLSELAKSHFSDLGLEGDGLVIPALHTGANEVQVPDLFPTTVDEDSIDGPESPPGDKDVATHSSDDKSVSAVIDLMPALSIGKSVDSTKGATPAASQCSTSSKFKKAESDRLKKQILDNIPTVHGLTDLADIGSPSRLGQVICQKWAKKPLPEHIVLNAVDKVAGIQIFKFNTPSPDDLVKAAQTGAFRRA